jgi:hypothetical protein
MELEIIQEKKKSKKTNLYEFRFTFMENDADDFTTEVISFPVEKLADKEFMKELERFVKHIDECVRMDSEGRRGIDSLKDMYLRYGSVDGWLEYSEDIRNALKYNYGGDDIIDFLECDEIDPDSIQFNEEFAYHIPTCHYGEFYNSYYSLKMVYFDEVGDEYEVAIKY